MEIEKEGEEIVIRTDKPGANFLNYLAFCEKDRNGKISERNAQLLYDKTERFL